jgi:hypothetical protein
LGFKAIFIVTGISGLKFYALRHSFGSIARNNCRLDLGFIGETLNHIEKGRNTTRIYIEKDWSIVDDVQNSRRIDSETNKRRNLGTFESINDAKKHEKEIQYFKHH